MSYLKISSIVLITLLIILNCGKEKPLPTAYDQIFGNREGAIVDTVLFQASNTEQFYSRLVNAGAASNLLLGKYDNYESAVYLKFVNLPDSGQIHSAKLKLSVIEKIGTTDSTYWTLAHPYVTEFFLSDFDWDNTQDPEQYLPQLPFNNSRLQSAIFEEDSSKQIEVELDTVTVQGWVDSTIVNHGFWMRSPESEFVSSFYSRDISDPNLVPTLELIYSFRDSTGIKRDTIKVYSGPDAFLILNSTENLNLDKDFFYIGKGIAFRSFIKFDLQGLDSTIHVNRALLKIVVDKKNSIRNAFDASDCRIYRLEGASWIKGEVNEEPATGTYSGTQSDSTLTFDLSPSLHGMLGNKYPNYGFLVRSNNESATISRVAFYSSKAEIELQPRLFLYYTLPPKQEF